MMENHTIKIILNSHKNMSKNPPSKLKLYPDYMNEYKCNSEYLNMALNVYIDSAKEILIKNNLIISTVPEDRDLFNKFFIPYRIQDILISVTDDLIRYASYHKIGTEERNNGDKIFSISEPVRATFFTKWILKTRPSIIDALLSNNHQYISSEEENCSFSSRSLHKIEFCNEHISLILMSIILNIKYKDEDKIVSYERLFDNNELSTLFYSLRYRIVHQDSYGFLYRKIFNLYNDEKVLAYFNK
jgi:hypothetical protein